MEEIPVASMHDNITGRESGQTSLRYFHARELGYSAYETKQMTTAQAAGAVSSEAADPVGVMTETVPLFAPVGTGRNRQSILRRNMYLGRVVEHRCFET
jgi:hypothetical protein